MDDIRLEPGEIRVLAMFYERGNDWLSMPSLSDYGRACVDMLVLSGLLERRGDAGSWLDEWRLTPEGLNIINLEAFRQASPDGRIRPVC